MQSNNHCRLVMILWAQYHIWGCNLYVQRIQVGTVREDHPDRRKYVVDVFGHQLRKASHHGGNGLRIDNTLCFSSSQLCWNQEYYHIQYFVYLLTYFEIKAISVTYHMQWSIQVQAWRECDQHNNVQLGTHTRNILGSFRCQLLTTYCIQYILITLPIKNLQYSCFLLSNCLI